MGVPGKEMGVLESPEKVDLWAPVTGRELERSLKVRARAGEAPDLKSLSR